MHMPTNTTFLELTPDLQKEPEWISCCPQKFHRKLEEEDKAVAEKKIFFINEKCPKREVVVNPPAQDVIEVKRIRTAEASDAKRKATKLYRETQA